MDVMPVSEPTGPDAPGQPIGRPVAYAMLGAAGLLGFGSLLAFVVFVFRGSSPLSWTGVERSHALLWDTGLSLTFFVVHSGLVRRSFRAWSARLIPQTFAAAVYAIASGVALFAVVLFWVGAEPLVFAPPGAIRWSFRAAFLLGALVFLWGGMSLKGFDPCGLTPIVNRLRDMTPRPMPFSVRGPYRWVRHPLYSAIMVMTWSCPDLTADRLLFDVLWTGWIVAAARLEERDLVEQFGRYYEDYQRRVPMFIPGTLGRPRSSSGLPTDGP